MNIKGKCMTDVPEKKPASELTNALMPDLTPLTWQERMNKLIPEIALFRFLKNPEDPAARQEMYKSALGTHETEAMLAPHKMPDESWANKTKPAEERKGFLSWLGF
jgi:hypothetical protein